MNKAGFLTTRGVILTALLLTAVAWLENTIFIPWSPFMVATAVLSIGIPIWLHSYRFGSIREIPWWHWPAGFFIAILLQFVGVLIFAVVVPQLLSLFGVRGPILEDPFYSLAAAQQVLFQAAGIRFDISAEEAARYYLIFTLLWAGVGEELVEEDLGLGPVIVPRRFDQRDGFGQRPAVTIEDGIGQCGRFRRRFGGCGLRQRTVPLLRRG